MDVTYNWVIDNMSCHSEMHGEVDVVYTVAWTLSGTDGEHSSEIFGSINLEYLAGSPYIQYADLTEEKVISWVKDVLGEHQILEYQGLIWQHIEAAKAPPVVIKKLPWA